MPLISVVVPLYNKAPYVARALASILAQRASMEIIVVDDGSTDGGAERIAALKDPRITLLRQANAGPGAARNRGLAHASGELIAFLDADDEWLPGYLETAELALARHPDAATYTAAYLESPAERSSEPMWRRRALRDGVQRITPETPVELLIHSLAFMSPCTTVARTSIVRDLGAFFAGGSRYGEDAYLWLKVLLSHPVLFDLTPRVRIHFEASALARGSRTRPLEPFLQCPESIEQTCPPRLRTVLARFLAARAFKTACVWGYWGDWRRARDLRRRFRRWGHRGLPFFWRSLFYTTPAGAVVGTATRRLGLGPDAIRELARR